jgi:purine-binding chemotaxis protein CheW
MNGQAMKEESDNSLVSTFYLGNTLLGINTLQVQEIIRVTGITIVHHASDYILGIINLRGKIVTVIDLGNKLDLPGTNTTEENRIIIVEWKGEYVGFLVDRVADVISVDFNNIIPPPSNVKGAQGRFFEGVYNDGSHLIAILKTEEVLSVDEK